MICYFGNLSSTFSDVHRNKWVQHLSKRMERELSLKQISLENTSIFKHETQTTSMHCGAFFSLCHALLLCSYVVPMECDTLM